ncbi:MAG: signal peptidase I [Sphingomonadales bacterium]
MNASDTVSATPAKPKKSETMDFIQFLVKLVIVVVIIRSFFVATFSIPSESMMPRLLVGDYLFVQKWPYGYSRYSFPFSPPIGESRVLSRLPQRGDVVVFKAPPSAKTDYIKRVIGLPGDTVQMRDGILVINGRPIPKTRVDDLVLALSPNSPCFAPEFAEAASDGTTRCRYPRYRETLPNGKSYEILDIGDTEADHTRVFTVPAGHLFMMGDDRDKSADSRFPAVDGGGIGFVPVQNLVGKAWVGVFSTDGSAKLLQPWTWFTAARPNRIGMGF